MSRRAPGRVLRRLERHRCVVSTTDGQSFEGILWEADREVLVLVNAELRVGQVSQPVDGELVIERARIVFLQFP